MREKSIDDPASSNLTGTPAKRVAVAGGLWIFFAPLILFLAALGAPTDSPEFVVAAIVAAAGFTFGVGGVGGNVWAARGLFILSSLCGIVLVIGGMYVVLLPHLAWRRAGEAPPLAMAVPLALMLVAEALPFLFLAVAIRRALRSHALATADEFRAPGETRTRSQRPK